MKFWNFGSRLSLALTIAAIAFVLSFPGWLGFSKRFEIQPKPVEGYLLVSSVENSVPRIRGRSLVPPEKPRLLENGVPLAYPNSSEKQTRQGGFGRYTFKGREIFFSTSDGKPVEDRRYEVIWPLWSLPEGILQLPWLVALVSLIFAFRDIPPRLSVWRTRLTIIATGGLLLACMLWPSQAAASFFDGLLFPLLWAALVAAWAVQSGRLSYAATCILALLPVGAAAFVYLVEARSQGSFLVAGVIPRSDAWLHFIQAIEIANSGGTDVFFNGRLIYPAFLSSLLALTGLNLAVSNYLTAVVVLLTCGIASRHLAVRAGWFSAAVLCLVVWVYYRNDGCGAAMTENFGLLAGLLALPFLVKSFQGKRLPVFFIGILLLGIGFSARPGALFLLPALGLAAGFLVWRERQSLAHAVAAIAIAGTLGLAGLSSNALLTSAFLRADGVTFGNFAYSLHGLLHGTDWEDSYFKYQGDTKKIMQINRDRLRDDPASLLRGISRAYGETFGRRFLFRFGRESRLAALGMIGFCIAGVAPWFLRNWKSDAPWLTASVLGILASIPFAPPWDASVRPYAVTIPLQAYLASVGWIIVFQFAGTVIAKTHSKIPSDKNPAKETSLWAPAWLAIFVMVLTFVGPFLFRANLVKAKEGEIAFLPGASVSVSEDSSQLLGTVPATTFRRGLSELEASYPKSLEEFADAPRSFRYGIRTSDLEVVIVPLSHPQKTLE